MDKDSENDKKKATLGGLLVDRCSLYVN